MPPLPPNSHLTKPKTMTPAMKPLPLLLLAVLAVSSPLLAPSAAAKAKGPPTEMPLKDICDRTRANQPEGTYELCMSALQSAADAEKTDTSQPLDLATALSLSVDATLDYALTAIAHASGLLEDPKTEQKVKNCLIQCKARFADSIDILHEIKDRTKDITYDWQKDKSVGAELGASIGGVDLDCRDTFDASGLKSAMPEIQEKLNKLWVISKVIANIIFPEGRFEDMHT